MSRAIKQINTFHPCYFSETTKEMSVNNEGLLEKLGLLSRKLEEEKEARIKAEKALKRYQARICILNDNLVDVIWQMDLRLKFTYVSPSVFKMTGFTVEEWIGTHLYQYAGLREFYKMARKALDAIKNFKTKDYFELAANMIKKNGEEYTVEIVGKVLVDEKGLPTGVQGSTRDISRRKILEAELSSHSENLEELVRQRTADLEEKNKELERLNELFVGREFRIRELRDELKDLKESL